MDKENEVVTNNYMGAINKEGNNNQNNNSKKKQNAQFKDKLKRKENKPKRTDEFELMKERCHTLENRCLSLALENKILRSKVSKDEKSKIDILNKELKNKQNNSLNQSNWQPTMNDISEIALISGLSIDRARQAFTTIIEDSTEFRANNQLSMDEMETDDVVSRIDFLMNELNRLMDGVEHPIRPDRLSQCSINFSKISENNLVNASISQDNILVRKKSDGR